MSREHHTTAVNLHLVAGERRKSGCQARLDHLIQRLRIVEFNCSENGLCDDAATVRTVIDELILDARRTDPISQALNEGDGVYRP